MQYGHRVNSLTYLNAGSCGMKDTVPYYNMTKLEEVKLGGNHLSTVPDGTNFPSLTKLILNSNDITNISYSILSGYSNVMEIEIDGNKLRVLPNFTGISHHLSRITAKSCQMEKIPQGHLLNLPALEYLRFNDNKLIYVSFDFVVTSPKLININIQNNNLETIDPIPSGRSFGIGLLGNPLDCSTLCWLWGYIPEDSKVKQNLLELQCAAPPNLACLLVKHMFYHQCPFPGGNSQCK